MITETKRVLDPEEVGPRFCGYCGKSLMKNLASFVKHLGTCELKKSREAGLRHGKKENK